MGVGRFYCPETEAGEKQAPVFVGKRVKDLKAIERRLCCVPLLAAALTYHQLRYVPGSSMQSSLALLLFGTSYGDGAYCWPL